MCIKYYQDYTECRHISTKLINCPTYYKQRDSANGFFSRLFNRKASNKNCGRVVPHHLIPRPFCQACTIKNECLRVKHIGDGALRIQRPVVEENFGRQHDRYGKSYKYSAKESLAKPERYVSHGQQKRNHVAISSKPGVWIPELYHHPETMARREPYCRDASKAPPVCPPRPQRPSTHQSLSRSSEKGTGKVREGHSNNSHEYKCNAIPRGPMFGSSQPLSKPIEPPPSYRCRGRSAHDSSASPPTHERPPLPPQASRYGSGIRPQRPQRPERPLVIVETVEPIPAGEYPRLRHKAGRVYNISVPRPDIPLPEYQVYLNALSFASSNSPSDAEKMARMTRSSTQPTQPTPMSSRYYKHHEKPKLASLARLGKGIGIESSQSSLSDESSDLSFVCAASKKLTQ
ncbi:hypothetical protein F5B20DRAFT_543483 [Whalleya microplaca]|nr:hypothetical protein F5B20DRAFT_543483 [Whalleya microplaca]